jgi:hypothetical protein
MNNVASSPSVPSASPPVAGSSLVPYNNSQRMVENFGMQLEMLDTALCKLLNI